MASDVDPRHAQRRTLLEWIVGSVMADVPNSRLASALESPADESWDAWLMRAAEVLGWEAERVEAAPNAMTGERESWWVTGVLDPAERWLVLTGQRGAESRATLVDGTTARNVPMQAEQIAEALGQDDPSQPVVWIRLVPALSLERVRSARSGPKLEPLERLRRWLGLERRTLLAVVAYSAGIGAISLAIPLAVQSLVNSLAFGRILQPLIVISLALLFLLSLSAALRVLEVYIVEMLQRRVFVDVARDVARRLPAARPGTGGPWGFTERINRFFDVVGAQKSASFLLLNATEAVMTTLAGLVVLAFYHPYLLLFDIVLVAALGFVIFQLGTGGIGTAVQESYAKYELAAWLEAIARRQGRFSTPEGAAWGTRQTEQRIVDWLTERAIHFRIVMRQTVGFAVIQAVASAGLLGLGGFLVWRGQLSLGQLVASELIITGVLAQFAKFGKHAESFYDLNASVDKVGILLDLETEAASGELLEDRDEGIEIEARELILEERACSLRIEPGERIGLDELPHRATQALFGAIFGTRRPEQGNILLDGIPVTSLAPRARRHRIKLVNGSQTVAGTLEDNLTSQDGRSTSAELRAVLTEVGLGELLVDLPEGLQTWIHSNGDPLSRAQIVALDVARVLLRQPRLILVDHALDILEPHRLEPVLEALTRADVPWTLVIATERREILDRCHRFLRWTDLGLDEEEGA